MQKRIGRRLLVLAGIGIAALLISSHYISLFPLLGPLSRDALSTRAAIAAAGPFASLAAESLPALERVMSQYGSRLSHAEWIARAGNASAPPIFFVTSSRSGSKQSPGVLATREEQYASSLGGILALGYQVFLTVTPMDGHRWKLIEALAAAAAPGQLRIHYCSNATRVSARTAGPDEVLCMQESIEAFFGGCLAPSEPAALLAPAPLCCPAPDTHVIRMSGRYLLVKYPMLHAILSRGKSVDAFVKWGPIWAEPAVTAPQVYTFFLSMKVRRTNLNGLAILLYLILITPTISHVPPVFCIY